MSCPPQGEYQLVQEMKAQPPGRSTRSISATTGSTAGVCSSRFEQKTPSTLFPPSGRSPAAAIRQEIETFLTDALLVEADKSRMFEVLSNLVRNAIKFTKEGRIEIAVELAGDELIYRVSDTGIGIPRSELENVFAEFRQVDATVTREFGGTGLGLAITKKFAEMHGGRVWVESEFGKGCTFFLCMPLRVKGKA